MLKTGGYWADEQSPRIHCYRIVPLDISDNAREMTVNGFDRVYHALGELGYKFRDSGHNHERVVVSLDKPISPKHKKQLVGKFDITDDAGSELAFV